MSYSRDQTKYYGKLVVNQLVTTSHSVSGQYVQVSQSPVPEDLGDTDEITVDQLKAGAGTIELTDDGTVTLPTAKEIIDMIKELTGGYVAASSSFEYTLINTDAEKVPTLDGGAGVTIVGAATVPAESTATFRFVVTDVEEDSEAVKVYKI